MQWGDLSFQNDFIGNYVSERAAIAQSINLRRIPILLGNKKHTVSIDSRFSKIKALS
jgi:hypothetical protein